MSISVLGVILLIIVGLILLIIEVFILPGISIAGVGALLFYTGGIVLAYTSLGVSAGHITLLAAFLSSVITIFFSFRAKTWQRMALHAEVNGKAMDNEIMMKIKPGDLGKALSRLAPMGNVEIDGKIYEGQSIEGYIEPDSEIEVVKVEQHKIIIKPKK
jgi:membrane-bound ClpP family serine protease